MSAIERFSIIIPTWNNLEYLKTCLSSIKKNSRFTHQVIVYVNEGNDGTLEWVKEQTDIDYLHAAQNEGICIAVNSCRQLVRTEYIVYMNDDMYVCKDWDFELYKAIENIGHDKFMLSSTLIEPRAVNNPGYVSIVNDFGDSLESFKEPELLETASKLHKENWWGASWPPSIVSTRIWDIVGGYSIEFSPGMYSDPDFSMKLWRYGVRIFMGVGSSKVYHFQSKSTGKVKKNKGNDMFLLKWGVSARIFYRHYLLMGTNYKGPLMNVDIPTLAALGNKLKSVYKSIQYKR
jgi:glycosyltransferase involved in cell wall biosynthesis